MPSSPIPLIQFAGGRVRRFRAIVFLLLLALTLSACAEEASGPEEDRRFANEEVTSVATESAPDAATSPPEAPTATSPGSGEALLASEGAAPIVVIAEDGELKVVDISAPMTARSLELAEGDRVVDYAASRDGSHVAALVLSGEPSELEPALLLFDPRGEELGRWELGGWVDSPTLATPEAAFDAEGVGSVTWKPGNERLLVTLFGKSLLDVSLDGDVQEILVTSRAGTLLDAAWSPSGEHIALKTRNGAGTGTVWVFNPGIDGDSFKQVIPPPADASNLGSVTEVEWLPSGDGLVYILAQDATDASRGGQLYAIDLDTRERRVIATPGRGGPAAQITEFTVSPDGASVAYTIEEPVGDGWRFHSLWIRSLDSALFIDLPTSGTDTVGAYWWIGDGFAWTYESGDSHGIAFKREGDDPGLLWAPSQSASATPQASPIAVPGEATPDAPAASPIATPEVQSPAASPDAS